MADVVGVPWHAPTKAVAEARKLAPPTWRGVVAVYRPLKEPLTRKYENGRSEVVVPSGLCRVESARFLGFNATRAIICFVPWKLVRRFFGGNDECAYVWAEYHDADKSVWFHERGSQKEFFETARGGITELPNEGKK